MEKSSSQASNIAAVAGHERELNKMARTTTKKEVKNRLLPDVTHGMPTIPVVFMSSGARGGRVRSEGDVSNVVSRRR